MQKSSEDTVKRNIVIMESSATMLPDVAATSPRQVLGETIEGTKNVDEIVRRISELRILRASLEQVASPTSRRSTLQEVQNRYKSR